MSSILLDCIYYLSSVLFTFIDQDIQFLFPNSSTPTPLNSRLAQLTLQCIVCLIPLSSCKGPSSPFILLLPIASCPSSVQSSFFPHFFKSFTMFFLLFLFPTCFQSSSLRISKAQYLHHNKFCPAKWICLATRFSLNRPLGRFSL